MDKKYCVWLEDIEKSDAHLYGDTIAEMGELINAGFFVPYGFVITDQALEYFLRSNDLETEISRLKASGNTKDIKELVLKAQIPSDLKVLISTCYHDLLTKEAHVYHKQKPTSALLAELKSYYTMPKVHINNKDQELIQGENHLMHAVRDAWADYLTDEGTDSVMITRAVHPTVSGTIMLDKNLNEEIQRLREIYSSLSHGQLDTLIALCKSLQKFFYVPIEFDFRFYNTTFYITGIKRQTSPAKDEKLGKKPKKPCLLYLTISDIKSMDTSELQLCDGLIISSEELVAGLNKHPKQFILEKDHASFSNRLAEKLEKILKLFPKKPVLYRLSDFTSDQYGKFSSGTHHEMVEENPILGFHGTLRHSTQIDIFDLEFSAIKEMRKKGYLNLHILAPFVRSIHEYETLRRLVQPTKSLSDTLCQVWLGVDVPSVALRLGDYIKRGVDGIVIGISNLTKLTLGIDDTNASVTALYDVKDPAVVSLACTAVMMASKQGIPSIIAHSTFVQDTTILNHAIECGLTGISVRPQSFEGTKRTLDSVDNSS
ncbi:MAG: putative PEP-binding protein [Candidatus Roizmanbacteria bacterium]